MTILLAPAVLNTVAPQRIVRADTAIGTIRRDRGSVVDSYGNTTKVILPNFTSWELGQSQVINGITYYQVATNEYVAKDSMVIDNYGASAADTDTTGGLIGSIRQGGGIAVDLNGDTTGNYLATGSSWKLGKVVQIAGSQYYQVSSNGYLAADSIDIRNLDGRLINPQTTVTQAVQTISKTGTLGYAAKVITSGGQDTGLTLPAGSSWQLGQSITINGNNYYQVATNEYVLASLMTTPNNTATPTTPIQKTITLRYNANVVNGNGQSMNVTLPQGSAWKIGQTKIIAGHQYYQVATDEWVLATTDQNTSAFASGPVIVTLNSEVPLYDTASNSMSRALGSGTSWKVSGAVKNRLGQYFAKVSTNEWIPISSYVFNNSAVTQEITDSAALEPDFATTVLK
ncbi:hypothetical protein IV57_GL001419 [Companilactobacillus kimchiensis]|uniref:S-layer protein C-terminal domain-containing protein n=2 Tax=Companilactobacillus kimchiensis TaxID=993692 RepID=A0A0R2LJM2_9LACO|nr:hypothetical protein IV57_GL001419 [Companilactobacillus kimchiensis]